MKSNKIHSGLRYAIDKGWLRPRGGQGRTYYKIAKKHNMLGLMYLQDGKCWICKEVFKGESLDMLSLDHWLPAFWGGNNSLRNLRVAHRKCNNDKGCMITTDALRVTDLLTVSKRTPPSRCPTCRRGWPDR